MLRYLERKRLAFCHEPSTAHESIRWRMGQRFTSGRGDRESGSDRSVITQKG